MATENIMMDAVKAGGDRQELHERIRQLSMEAGKNSKEQGGDNNLLELIAADPAFGLSLEDLKKGHGTFPVCRPCNQDRWKNSLRK